MWIWLQGESAQGVAVLLAMHVAIALVTYNLLVHLAPVRAPIAGRVAPTPSGTGAPLTAGPSGR